MTAINNSNLLLFISKANIRKQKLWRVEIKQSVLLQIHLYGLSSVPIIDVSNALMSA